MVEQQHQIDTLRREVDYLSEIVYKGNGNPDIQEKILILENTIKSNKSIRMNQIDTSRFNFKAFLAILTLIGSIVIPFLIMALKR